MTEIPYTAFLKLLFGKQTIDNIRLDGDDVLFDECVPDPDTETVRLVSRMIGLSDLEDIAGFFASPLQSRPFAKHLLQILWIREDRFRMGPLEEDGMYRFLCGAFDICDANWVDAEILEDTIFSGCIDAETLENEVIILSEAGYLHETVSGLSLTSLGRRVAKKMFEVMKTPISSHVESEGTPETIGRFLAALEKLAVSASTPVVEKLEEIKGVVKKSDATREKDIFSGTYRAQARFVNMDDTDEIELDKARRLRKEGLSWKAIVKIVYPKTPREYLDKKADALRKMLERDREAMKRFT